MTNVQVYFNWVGWSLFAVVYCAGGLPEIIGVNDNMGDHYCRLPYVPKRERKKSTRRIRRAALTHKYVEIFCSYAPRQVPERAVTVTFNGDVSSMTYRVQHA